MCSVERERRVRGWVGVGGGGGMLGGRGCIIWTKKTEQRGSEEKKRQTHRELEVLFV